MGLCITSVLHVSIINWQWVTLHNNGSHEDKKTHFMFAFCKYFQILHISSSTYSVSLACFWIYYAYLWLVGQQKLIPSLRSKKMLNGFPLGQFVRQVTSKCPCEMKTWCPGHSKRFLLRICFICFCIHLAITWLVPQSLSQREKIPTDWCCHHFVWL